MSSIGAGLTVAAMGCTVQSCYGATEIRLALSTNADCKAHTQTQVLLGTSSEPVAVRDLCNVAEDPNLGTLTLVPSGDRDGTVFVKVVAAFGLPPEQCAAPKSADANKCIVARRRLRYIPHDAQDLPIVLRDSCRGVLCSEDETCDVDACTPIKNCDFEGCAREKNTPLPPPVPDSGADAPAADAADGADGADAGDSVPCTTLVEGQKVNGQLFLDPLRVWWPNAMPSALRFVDKQTSIVTTLQRTPTTVPTAISVLGSGPWTNVAYATDEAEVAVFPLGNPSSGQSTILSGTANFLSLTPGKLLASVNAAVGARLVVLDRVTFTNPATLPVPGGAIAPGASASVGGKLFAIGGDVLYQFETPSATDPVGTFPGIVQSLASNGVAVYFVHAGELLTPAPGGAPPLLIASGVSARYIAATSAAVYVISPAPAHLYRIAVDTKPSIGTPPVMIGRVPDDAQNLHAELRAGNLGRVYWVENNGTRIVGCDVP